VVVPVGLVGEGFVDAVVEVFVVGEDDVAADVVELRSISVLRDDSIDLETYEALWCDVSRGESTRCLVGVDDHP